MDYRDELDRAAHIHGYEEREDEPDCSKCIHNPMCSGKNCHFDRKWNPDDLEKRYYHVNDFEERMDDTLYSVRDQAEQFTNWPHDLDGPYFTDMDEWRRNHPKKDYRVRLTLELNISARDWIDARRLACEKIGVQDYDTLEEISSMVDMTRVAHVDHLNQYRMPVEYFCCEEGRTFGYDYTWAKSAEEAQFKFRDEWVPDIESNPCFDDIEEYDPEDDEWNSVYIRRNDQK